MAHKQHHHGHPHGHPTKHGHGESDSGTMKEHGLSEGRKVKDCVEHDTSMTLHNHDLQHVSYDEMCGKDIGEGFNAE